MKLAIPAVVLILAAPVLAQNAYHFAQIADGGGYTTKFLVQNTSTSAVNATLKFYADTGDPLSLTVDSSTGSSFSFSIPANGTKILTTSGGSSGTAVGWAVLRTDSLTDVLTSATFYYAPGGTLATVVGVPPTALSDSFTAPALNDNSTQLGFALANPNASEVKINLSLLGGDGKPTGKSTSITLPARGHTAFFLWQKFSDLGNFNGSCQFKADDSTPLPFALLALTQSGTIYSSTPATPRIAGINLGTGTFAVSPLFRGINYYINSPAAVRDSQSVVPEVRRVGIQVARYGGGGIDSSSPLYIPDNARLDRFVSYCRQIKVEPWIQVPLYYSYYNIGAKAPDVLAAEFVKYCNVDNNYNVKLWSIGNEPDIYRNIITLGRDYTPDDYSAAFRKISAAMKAVDPYIKIIGPELSNKYEVDGPAANNWLTPFLRSCGDIVDIVGVHRYPFDGTQVIAQSMTDPPRIGPLVDRLRKEIKDVTGRDIPLIFSENNLTYNWIASQMIPEGTGASLAAGLWWADVFGRFFDKNLFMAYHWDLVYDSSLSLFEGTTLNRRPTFYAFDLYSHFYNWRLPVESNAADLSVVASRNEGDESVSLVVVNRSAAAVSTAVRIAGSPAFAPGANYIRIQSAWDELGDRSITFPGYSMTCLQISRDGGTRRRWLYASDQFSANAAPLATDW